MESIAAGRRAFSHAVDHIVQRVWRILRGLQLRLTGGTRGAAAQLVSGDESTPAGSTQAVQQPTNVAKPNVPLPSLLDENWACVMTSLTPLELCLAAGVSPKFRVLSNGDNLWRAHCLRRWKGKQRMPDDLFRNGDYSLLDLTVSECKSLLERRDASCGHLCEKRELLHAVHSTNPRVIDGQPLPILGKWKTSYAYAEADSRRQIMTREEVSYFRWQLIYNGVPSTRGLRHFQKNGVFVSPHFGETSWTLDRRNNFVMMDMPPLQVRRNSANWGWIIGPGTGTEYHSVETNR